MTAPDSLWSMAQVAAFFGHSLEWMRERANRDALYARGFPRPIDAPGHPRWDPIAIRQWLRAQRGEPASPHANAPSPHANAPSPRAVADLLARRAIQVSGDGQ